MADLHKEFQNYHEEISLPKSKKEYLISGRDAVRERIENYFENEKEVTKPTFFQQGSFAIKTVVNPLSGEYDLDDGVYLQHLNTDNLPKTETVHGWFVEALKNHTKERPIDKNNCIRILYAGDYHIDLPIYCEKDSKILLARKGADQWINSDSKAFSEWFYTHLNTQGEQMRRIIKYMKAWKDYQGIDIPGIVFTVLCVQNFIAVSDRDDSCLVKVAENSLLCLKTNSNLNMPVEPYDDLLTKYSYSELDQLKSSFKNLIENGNEAIDNISKDEAIDEWGLILGDRFIKGVKSNGGDSKLGVTPIIIERSSTPKPWLNDGLVQR